MAVYWCHPAQKFRRNQVAWVVTKPHGEFINPHDEFLVEKTRFNSFGKTRFTNFGWWEIAGEQDDIVAIWIGPQKPTIESLNEWFAQRRRGEEAGKKAAQDMRDAIAKRAHGEPDTEAEV